MAIGAKNCTLSIFPWEASVITRLYRRSARSCGDKLEMSGARTPADWSASAARSSKPAWGSALDEPSTVLLRFALKPRPAAIAKRARKARAATIHGRELVLGSRDGEGPPAGAPQRWQNLAPGLRSEAQELHLAPASGAPQLAQ